MTEDEIFEIASHFYRQGFFEDKEKQFRKHYEDYLKELNAVLPQANVIKSVCDGNHKIVKDGNGIEYCEKCLDEYHNKQTVL